VLNVFEVHETISPLVLAKMQKKKRKRASGMSGKLNENNEDTDW
jgi:hypothetical protein